MLVLSDNTDYEESEYMHVVRHPGRRESYPPAEELAKIRSALDLAKNMFKWATELITLVTDDFEIIKELKL